MYKGPLLLPGHSDVRLRSPQGQMSVLKGKVVSLASEQALAHATHLKENLRAPYAGIVVVPRLDHFGALRIPAATDIWHKTSEWGMKTGIRGIEERGKFNPEDFLMEERTLSAFEELERLQGAPDKQKVEHNPLRVFPIRATTETDPVLEEREFLLDLASHMFILATHPDWRPTEKEVLFRCYGERFKPLGNRAILVGYRNLTRAVNFSSIAMTEGIALIGRIPD